MTLTLPLPQSDQHLLLDAIVSYSDACTLPSLTPSCPYYEETAAGPRCGEQCRDLIARLGIADRDVREIEMEGGGLVMRGRALPITAVAGHEVFDAQQLFITERNNAVGVQATSSLLLGVRGKMGLPPIDIVADRVMKTLEIIAELDRRGIPTERVIQAAILPRVATIIAAFAATPMMRKIMEEDAEISQDSLKILIEAAESGWSQVLESAIADDGGPEEAVALALRAHRGRRARPKLHDLASPELRDQGQLDALRKRISSIPEVAYIASDYFIDRVVNWLSTLLTDDLSGLIRWDAPPPSVFTALPDLHTSVDEVGIWVWERFTLTHIDDWSTSSLMLEWRCHNDTDFTPIPMRVWLERRTDPALISNLALSRLNRRPIPRSMPAHSLSASTLTLAAASRLAAGETQQAVDIFAGLVELRPADGEAWNNYGFCVMPLNVSEALEYLQRASLYPRPYPLTNVGNRILALHLLGQNGEAIALAQEALARLDSSGEERSATMWLHDNSRKLELGQEIQLPTYIRDLLTHIEEGPCGHSEIPVGYRHRQPSDGR